MSPCPMCRSAVRDTFLEIERVPLQIGAAWPTREQALAAPTGDVRLGRCGNCGLIFNAGYEPERIAFEPGYDVALTHSPTYRAYLRQEADRLVGVHGVRRGAVVELGCGDGYFLTLLCRLGGNVGDGFDPSLAAGSDEAVGSGRVRLHPHDLRPGEGQGAPAPALVVARSVLELVDDPGGFLRLLGSLTGPGSLLYLEVPNADWLFENDMAWNVHYEHRSYFTADVLSRACLALGLSVLECEPCYEAGQYLRLLATTGGSPTAVTGGAVAIDGAVASCAGGSAHRFAAGYRTRRSSWIGRLRLAKSQGRRVVLWGAGGRGTSFLASVDPEALLVGFAIDANPARHGVYLPMTGHPVRPPEALRGAECDVLLVSNPTYGREITATARGLGFEGEIWTL